MNANELADALDWVCENHLVGIGDADFKATATMLRQQQADLSDLQRHIPVKKVTEGEILNIYLCLTNGNKDLDLFEFAEEILKKAKK